MLFSMHYFMVKKFFFKFFGKPEMSQLSQNCPTQPLMYILCQHSLKSTAISFFEKSR